MKQLLSKTSDTKQSDFTWNKFIEKGAYGQVHKVTLNATKRVFAIKKLNKIKLFNQNMGPQIANEVNIMYSIKHPNIVKIIDSFQSDKQLFIVLEFMEGGSLFIQLKRKKKLDQSVVRKCLKDVINAVEYLHTMNPPIIHRDIKPQNVLIDRHGTCKLADFGWSNFSGILRVTYCGTAPYLAPQMILKQGHDQRLDYWCLGVLTYQLLCGYAPFDNGRGDTHQRAQQLQKNILDVKYRFPPGISKQAQNFIQNLLKRNPAQRMNIQQMKSHDFISGNLPPLPRPITRIVQQDGESQDTQIMRDDSFHILAQKLNKSQYQNRLLRQQLIYAKQQIKRLNQTPNQTIVHQSKVNDILLEQLKTKLKNQQLQNARLTLKTNELTKRVELQATYEVQLQQQIESLKAMNRQLRKYKQVQTGYGDSGRNSLASPLRSKSPSPQNSIIKSVDQSLKNNIIEQFSKLQKLHQSLKSRLDQSFIRQKQLQRKLLLPPQSINEKIQKIRQQYQQKTTKQFQNYMLQISKITQINTL